MRYGETTANRLLAEKVAGRDPFSWKSMNLSIRSRGIPFLLSLLLVPVAIEGGDWPMWRRDPARTGVSDEQLPARLHLQWVLELPTPMPAWPSDQDRLQFDRLYEPVLMGKSLFVCSMISDTVTAYDTETGRERWIFFADGPIRFAPVAWKGRLFCASDDGYLYCLNAADGSLSWKFRGGPSDRKVLGNDRLVSAWPARGAPVVYDGKVYFCASIWPFMGVFVYALDGYTGGVVWKNSGTGANYTTQQHDSPAFAGIAPQGYLAATEDLLLVAGGRTVPAVFDRHTGSLRHFNMASRAMGIKGGGGYQVTCGENFFLNRGMLYRLDNGHFVASVDAEVVSEFAIIGKDKQGILAFHPRWENVEVKDRKGKITKKAVVRKSWSAPLSEKIRRVFIRSGSRLYCSGEKGILAVELPWLDRGAGISWSAQIPDEPRNMIAGDGKLIVTTDRGRIYCYGEKASGLQLPTTEAVTLVPRGSVWRYLDDGSDQGRDWRQRGFDDDEWASGISPLGYGEGDEATKLSFGADPNKKPVTCYFRHRFQVAGSYEIRDLTLKVLADDGAVVHLNGKEVGRLLMPAGEATYKTLAEKVTEAKEFTEISLSGEQLRRGENVLAVEVHQASRASSDLRLDLELTGSRGSRRSGFAYLPKKNDRWAEMAAAILGQIGPREKPPSVGKSGEEASEGYCLAVEIGTGRLVEELAARSRLHIVVIDADSRKVDAFRRRLDKMGVYGTRIAVLVGNLLTMELPPYMAELVVAEDPVSGGLDRGRPFVERVFHSLRPYSGVACFFCSASEYRTFARACKASRLDKGRVSRLGDLAVLRRYEAPTGSGQWTHQNGDASNSVVSEDRLVKAPLGLLWFGGPSNRGVLPRHGHGPTPQVVGGRLFIEGRDMIRAVDIYTGRLLWERVLEDVGKNYDYTSHEPGANVLGSNYISLEDGVYVAHERSCLRLDPATGETISEIRLPVPAGGKESPEWGYVGAWKGFLVAGAKPTDFNSTDYSEASFSGLKDDALKKAVAGMKALKDFEPIPRRKNKKKGDKNEGAQNDRAYVLANANKLLLEDDMVARIPARVRIRAQAEGVEKQLKEYLEKTPGRQATDHEAGVLKRELLHRYYGFPKYERKAPGKFGSLLRAGSKKLVTMNRETGRILWEREARYQIRHNAIALGGGAVFYIDRMSDMEAAYYKRRGLPVNEKASVAAIDIRSGDALWVVSRRVFGTWLGYSEAHDVLLQAGSQSRDRARDEVGQGMVAYRGATGEVLWENQEKYGGPCLLLGDMIITQGSGAPGVGFDLLTGKPVRRPHPISGELTRWQYTRNYGCSTAIGCPNLLTFRSAAAGYYDLNGDSGTGNFGGFRSGCTSSLIPAGGVLNAPDYTRTCTCAYQNQSSLAFVHMPEVEAWTFSSYGHDGKPVRKLGLNFGAPGDRRGPDGTLWLDYPSVGGHSPDVPVQIFSENHTYLRDHASQIRQGELKWVAASAFRGEGEIAVSLLSPTDFMVANEAEGKPSLKVSNWALSAAVSARNVRLSGERNLSSLKGQSRGGKPEAVVFGYEQLATPSVTVEFWVRADCDFDYVDARGRAEKSEQGFVIDNRALRLRYYVAQESGDDNEPVVRITAKEAIRDNEWIHVAFTYDASSGVGTLYQGGKVVGRHDGPAGRPLWWDQAGPDLVVGRDASDHSHLDELRVCSVVLRPDEFLPALDRLEGQGGGDGHSFDPAGVVGYWRMESAIPSGGEPDWKSSMTYTVRMIFAEIEGLGPGQRIFDVDLQGRRCLRNFDIVRDAGGPNRTLVREFKNVRVHDHLRIQLRSGSSGTPLLNGVQVIRDSGSF